MALYFIKRNDFIVESAQSKKEAIKEMNTLIHKDKNFMEQVNIPWGFTNNISATEIHILRNDGTIVYSVEEIE